MAQCPNCSAENAPGVKFCGECGSGLALLCPNCGTANEPSRKFCGECGSSLLAGAAAAGGEPVLREAPAAERRLVSVLFADLVGFTTLSETRDSEEVRQLLSRYFDVCRRLIELYGGTVEKFIGDAVMAVWGTPVATEDDAERAVRAALDLVTAVSALGDEVGMPELRARAGVLTGEAAVTIGATGEGMVAGDLVNTASRVQSAAEPGTVLVGESTKRTTEQTVVYAAAVNHELKGKVGLVSLYQALRVISGARGSLKSSGLEAPFVGRDRELRQIKDLFHVCADEGKAHLISVTGIAGIGKSRLSWEFYKYFDGIAQITYWHRGRCLSYGDGVTYWALADMVRMRARITEDEEPASALAKLAEVVEEHLPDPEERGFVEPRIAHLLGLEEGRYERDDLFAAWRLFFERLSDVYPALLVFEDMQWADQSLLDFIEYLLDWSRNSPIYVVTLARPELLERRPTWGAGHRNFSSIYLEPLSETAMDALLAGLVPGLPDGIKAQILGRAEGIPLYAVETVRMLLDRGALVQDGPAYRLVGAVEALEVPETLHALIAARLDGLPPVERRLIQDAAVLGKTFTKQSVGSLTGLGQSELDAALSSLTRKEVLVLQSDPRSPEHGQYGFLQDLLRKVAYETLAKPDRKARHLAAAAQLEQGWAEQEVVEVVASHYLAAFHAAPDADDAAEIRAKAGDRLARAGERAGSLGANEEAQRYFTQAAELEDADVPKAMLLERAGRMAWLGARLPDARALLDRAAAVFAAEGLTHPAARVSSALADIDYREGHPASAAARLDAALTSLEDAEPDEVVAEVAAQLGRFLVLNRQYDLAAPRLEIALELAEALRLPEIFAQALTSKAIFYTYRSRLAEARILLEGALEQALAGEFSTAALRTFNNLAVVLESSDSYVDAVDLIDRALELARRMGHRLWEAQFTGGPISSYVALGRWDEGITRLREFEAMNGMEIDPSLALPTVEIFVARGDLAAARTLLEKLDSFADVDDLQIRASYILAEAQILRAEGRTRDALEAAERALAYRASLGIAYLTIKSAVVEALDDAFSLGDADRVLELLATIDELRRGERPPALEAHAHRFRGKLESNEREFAAATACFRDLSLRFYLGVNLLEHGELLLEHGRSDEAAPLLTEARQIFEEVGAQPWLDRVAGHAETTV